MDLSFATRPNEQKLNEQLQELVCYLWDNYLEGYASHEIVVMGIGNSYMAVKLLLTNRGKLTLPPAYPKPEN